MIASLSHSTEKKKTVLKYATTVLSYPYPFKLFVITVIKTASNNKINSKIIITNSTHIWGLGIMSTILLDVQPK
jgi:hypothetical protein